MNLLVEEDYEFAKIDYYSGLLKRYFHESYVKFSQEPEYLFYTAITASMSEWFMGINAKTGYYAKIILDNDLIKLSLCDKGALGRYVVEMIKATIKYEKYIL